MSSHKSLQFLRFNDSTDPEPYYKKITQMSADLAPGQPVFDAYNQALYISFNKGDPFSSECEITHINRQFLIWMPINIQSDQVDNNGRVNIVFYFNPIFNNDTYSGDPRNYIDGYNSISTGGFVFNYIQSIIGGIEVEDIQYYTQPSSIIPNVVHLKVNVGGAPGNKQLLVAIMPYFRMVT